MFMELENKKKLQNENRTKPIKLCLLAFTNMTDKLLKLITA